MRKFLVILAVFAILAMGAPVTADAKSTVTIALSGEPPTMDPHRVSNFVGAMVWRWSYDTLLHAETGTGAKKPWLATKWTQLGPLKWKFQLRKGVKFSDGSPFTAESFKYTISRIMKSARQRQYFKNIDKIEVIDDHTFIYHNKEPDGGMWNRLTRWAGPISLKTKGMELAHISRNTYGTGPYVLKSWTKGQKMVFEANPNWWNNKNFPKRPQRIVLRRIRETATRAKALQAGEIDVAWGIMPQFIPQLEKNPKTKVAVVPAVRIMHMGFFTQHGGPMANMKVRKAINYAIDAEAIRTTILGGRADLFGQMLHPWNYSGYNPKKKWYGYDPAKAKALLKEAGHEKGFKMEIIATNGRYPGDKATCEAIAGMVKKIGVNATCNSQRFPLFKKLHRAYKAGKKKGAAAYYMGFGNGQGDSTSVLRGTSSCKGPWSGMCYPELDKAIDAATATVDPKKQQMAFEGVTDLMKKLVTHKIVVKIHDVLGHASNLKWIPRHDETLLPWEIGVLGMN